MSGDPTRGRNLRLVRTSVGGDDHALVLRRSADVASGFGPLFDLLPGDEPADAVAITYRGSERFLREWRERTDRRPRNVGVLGVGERMRSAAADPRPVEHAPVRGVADPTDGAAIRRATERYLDAWPDDGRAVVYFDSVTALREHLEAGDAAAFLGRFREALDARNAVGYFCLDPDAHDRRVVRQVAAGFDTVVEQVETEEGPASRPAVDDCLDALADARRRRLLAVLADGEAVPVGDLADAVAERESADAETVRVSLVSVHLPKLADLGVVTYDGDAWRVAPGVHFEAVVPFLRTAPDMTIAPEDRS